MSQNNKSSLISFFILSAIAGLILLFQSCGQIVGEDSSPNEKSRFTSQSNGDGYGGKASYANYDFDHQCSNSGVSVRNRIENIEGEFYQTVKDCKKVEPNKVEKADVQIAEHNKEFAFKTETLFEAENVNGISEILCRGEGYDEMDSHYEAADVYIRQVNGKLYGNISYGIYENGILVKEKHVKDLEVQKFFAPDGRLESYDSLIPSENSGGSDFILQLSTDGQTATLHALELADFGEILTIPPVPNGEVPLTPALPLPSEEDRPVAIENLKCYKHSQSAGL
ncbi:MAG: hypothetical protein KDD33_05265 [Bdellovibrionales bacterium]|nr:hypothetical protein [Bdellovibrionales bacterium]